MSIRNNIGRTALLLAAAGALAAPSSALADTKLRDVSIDHVNQGFNFTSDQLVVSGNGDAYDTLQDGHTAIPLKIHAKIENVILAYKIFDSRLIPNMEGPGKPSYYVPTLALNYAAREIDEHKPFHFQFTTNSLVGQKAIELCNGMISAGGSRAQQHQATLDLPMIYFVHAGKRLKNVDTSGVGVPAEQNPTNYSQKVSKTANTVAQVPIVCKPLRKTANDDLAHDQGKLQVRDVKLFLTTYSHATTSPNPGTVCPKLKVTARFETNRKGLVHFDLTRKVGDQPLATIPITVESKHKGDGTFEAEYENWWSVSETSYAQFMAQETEGLGLSSGWKDITLHCTGAGGGGLANPELPDNDQPSLKVLESSIKMVHMANNSPTTCPRTVHMDVEFITNKAGGVPFRITGTDGSVINSSVASEQELGPLMVGPDQMEYAKTYRATYRRTMVLDKATDRDYALEVRNVSVLPEAKHAGPAKLKVNCTGDLATPFDVSGADLKIISVDGQCPKKAFVTARYTTVGAGEFPYFIGCSGGAQDSGKLVSKKVGSSFSAQHVMTVDINNSQKLICHARAPGYGGTAVFETKNFNCDGIDPAKDLTAGNKPTHSGQGQVFPVIVTPTPGSQKPECKGGKVATLKSNPPQFKCVCPAKHDLKQTGGNSFACIKELEKAKPKDNDSKTKPKIACAGGSVQQNSCLCPPGTARKQTGGNSFVCHKTAQPAPKAKLGAPVAKAIPKVVRRAAP